MKYQLEHHSNQEARCSWCWHTIPASAEPHSVVKTVSPPHMEMHFHNHCWQEYKAVSGAELEARGSHWRGWKPERIEALRMWVHQDRQAFARGLGIGVDRLQRVMLGKESLSAGILIALKRMANKSAFERSLEQSIDWGDRRAGFCLRMHMGLSQLAMSKTVGCEIHTVRAWEARGVPRRSLRIWGILNRLAAKHNFDGAMVLPDREWTVELLKAAIEKSERTKAAWALAAGCSRVRFLQWSNGEVPIKRDACWFITKAATQFELPLPPAVNVTRPKKDAGPKWTIETLLKLGTAPDRTIAEELGRRTGTVKEMRQRLGIKALKRKDWDGQRRPCPISQEELERRWDELKAQERVKNKIRRGTMEQEEVEARELLE
jgi:DNA-binding transcriptional regulator YiaG